MTTVHSERPPQGVDLSYVEQLPEWLTFDQFGRYSLLREALMAARPALGGGRLAILDIGAWTRTVLGGEGLPVMHFLPDDDVLALDQVESNLPNYRQGNGTRLDFADQSFDFVISADTLEHVPPAGREAFVAEMLRVARFGLLLIAPMRHPAVDTAEELLFDYIKAELGVTQVQLAEHRENGLPELAAVMAQLTAANLPYYVYPSGYIHSWLAMMLAKHYLWRITHDPAIHMRVDQYYIRFLATDERREPSYRHCVIAAKENRAGWLEAVEAALRPTVQPPSSPLSGDWRTVAGWLSDLLALRHAAAPTPPAPEILALQQALISQQQQNESLLAMLHQRDAQIADLEQRARWYHQLWQQSDRQLQAVAQGRVMRLLGWLLRKRAPRRHV